MILFVFFFLFFATSLALIPGDFGSANNGPPDGVVDFEDLMIFAMAYGSTPSDANWNEVCDIAGPDGVIDFEDLMIFAMHYGEEAQVIIPDTTEIIDQETEQVVTSVSEDQSSIIFSHSTTQTDRIDPGDIIVMGVTDQTPYGLLRRVTNINKGLTKGSQVILDTEFTTLEEAIQKGHWEYDHTLKPEDIEKGFVFPEGIQPVRGKASTSLDFEYQIDLILYDQDDNPDTIENNIMATGYLAFNYQIIFDGDIDGFTLKYFIFKNIIQAESKLEISVGASVSIADLADIGDLTIGKPIPFTPVTVPCPPPAGFPLVFFPSIELKVGLEGEAYIKLTTGIRQTASYTAGIEFTEGNWDNITTPPQVDYYEDPIEVNGGIHVIAHAGPQLNCKLYKVAGPYCNIFGYLDFEADTTLDPWWDLDAGLKVSAGVKVDILTFHWESDELEVINLPVDIADAGGPFGSTGPVHNLSQGTYYDTIQAALDDADTGDTIEVSPGTYYENINFLGKNITLRSTDTDDPSVVESTIIDGGGKNGSVVTFASGETAQAVLCGFTIQNGNAFGGAGIWVDDYSSPTITGNTITGNTATHSGGGGIFVTNESFPTITGNTITGNTALSYVGSNSYGGGIWVNNESFPIIEDNIISGNTAEYGGGISVTFNSPIITGNTITGNTAIGGGGIQLWDCSPIITDNTITGNTAISYGGGIGVSWYSDPTITGNTIEDNTAVNYGGGIFVSSDRYSDLLPATDRPTGWGTGRENIPIGNPLDPAEGVVYTIAGNEFLGNDHGDPLAYTEGAHVYFQ
jgi:parallel beta-helix repeat protein